MNIENGYKNNIDLQDFNGKLYIDPEYGEFKPRSVINHAILIGKWNIEDLREDNGIKIIQRETGYNIVLSFESFADKVAFAKILYSSKPVRQIGSGFNLEMYINENVLYPGITFRSLLLKHKIKELLPQVKIDKEPLNKGIDYLIKKLITSFRKIKIAG
jgi:hypothetical protein